MDDARLASLLDEASNRYNDGRYDEAIALWQEVLALDPESQKAKEGIRMASLLVQDWEDGAGSLQVDEAAADDAELRARVAAGVARVRDLAAAGQVADALEGCALLEEIAPDLEEVRRLARDVRGFADHEAARAAGPAVAAGAADRVEAFLARARAALAEGRDADAAAAARRALQADPSNNEALGILSLTGDTGAVGTPEPPAAPSVERHETGPIPITAATLPDFEPLDLPPGLPAAPARPAAAARADSFEEASGSRLLTPESLARIQALLAEGQATFDHGEPQRAIEVWSRIFAIDQANADAGARIDAARQALEEQARHVDELVYAAVDAHEAGRAEEAAETLRKVLSIAPEHVEAKVLLERFQEGGETPEASIAVDHEVAREAVAEKAGTSRAMDEGLLHGSSVPLAAPAPRARATPPAAAALQRPAATSTARRTARRTAAGAAGALLLGLVGVGAYVWFGTNSGSVPEAQATVSAAVRPGPLTTPSPPPASAGVTEPPLTVVPGGAPAAAPQKPVPAPLAPSAGAAAKLQQEGRRHFQQRRWAEAVLTLRKALQADPLGFESQDILDKAMAQLERQARLESEMAAVDKAFGEGDYGMVLHKLYRLQQDFPDMRALDTYIRNSWFNWGVASLRDGAVEEAEEKFTEVLGIDGSDRSAARAREVAQRYRRRQPDEALTAFAAALPVRRMDQK